MAGVAGVHDVLASDRDRDRGDSRRGHDSRHRPDFPREPESPKTPENPLAQLIIDVNALESVAAGLEAETNSLARDVEVLNARANTLDAKFNVLSAGVTALGARANTLDANFNSLSTGIGALNGRANALEANFNALSAAVAALNARANTLDGNFSALNSSISALSARAGTLDSQVTALQNAINALNTGASALDARIDALETAAPQPHLLWIPHADARPREAHNLVTSFGMPIGTTTGFVIRPTITGTDRILEQGVQVPPGFGIRKIALCYQSSNAVSFISHIKLTQMIGPDSYTEVLSDDNNKMSTAPTCVDSTPALNIVDPRQGPVRLNLGVTFTSVAHLIMIRAIGLYLEPIGF
jgi:prefoldin subunit 5